MEEEEVAKRATEIKRVESLRQQAEDAERARLQADLERWMKKHEAIEKKFDLAMKKRRTEQIRRWAMGQPTPPMTVGRAEEPEAKPAPKEKVAEAVSEQRETAPKETAEPKAKPTKKGKAKEQEGGIKISQGDYSKKIKAEINRLTGMPKYKNVTKRKLWDIARDNVDAKLGGAKIEAEEKEEEREEVEETPVAEKAPQVITKKMFKKLRKMGYSEKDIKRMKPETAWDKIQSEDKKDKAPSEEAEELETERPEELEPEEGKARRVKKEKAVKPKEVKESALKSKGKRAKGGKKPEAKEQAKATTKMIKLGKGGEMSEDEWKQEIRKEVDRLAKSKSGKGQTRRRLWDMARDNIEKQYGEPSEAEEKKEKPLTAKEKKQKKAQESLEKQAKEIEEKTKAKPLYKREEKLLKKLTGKGVKEIRKMNPDDARKLIDKLQEEKTKEAKQGAPEKPWTGSKKDFTKEQLKLFKRYKANPSLAYDDADKKIGIAVMAVRELEKEGKGLTLDEKAKRDADRDMKAEDEKAKRAEREAKRKAEAEAQEEAEEEAEERAKPKGKKKVKKEQKKEATKPVPPAPTPATKETTATTVSEYKPKMKGWTQGDKNTLQVYLDRPKSAYADAEGGDKVAVEAVKILESRKAKAKIEKEPAGETKKEVTAPAPAPKAQETKGG